MFSRLLEGFIGSPVFKNFKERSTAKNYRLFSLLSVVIKVFEKLEKWSFFLVCSMVLGLLDQLKISLQFYLTELLELLTDLGLLELWHLIYPRLLQGLVCWSSSQTLFRLNIWPCFLFFH